MLIDLAACYRATRRDPPQALDGMLHLLVPPLLALTHGDGSLGSWQGAGAVSAEKIAALASALDCDPWELWYLPQRRSLDKLISGADKDTQDTAYDVVQRLVGRRS